MLIEYAPAKINLFLHITGMRPDGYHLLDSLAVFAGVHDRLTAEPGDRLSLTLAGPFAAGLGAGPDNLVVRAAKALARAGGVAKGAVLTLEKNLPVASGIGGGSADAAAALRLLVRLWDIHVPQDRLFSLAAALGADVPVCLASRPARMAGIGEALSAPPAMPPCGMVLVNPGVAVSTAAVFAARTGAFSSPATLAGGWRDAASMASDLRAVKNDLEPPALTLCRAVADALTALRACPGCLLARMSGSGATCFALFADAATARAAAADLARPGWWSWGGGLYDAAVAS